MRNIAIIPARSGSKGLKDKNIKLLNGKPLIWYTIKAAVEAGCFEEVMVSTDSEHYAEIARECGASVPFLRSADKSSDTAGSWDVVKEVLSKYQTKGITFDTVCLLQPTSPLRKAEHILGAYKELESLPSDAITSVCEVDHSPLWCMTLDSTLSLNKFRNNVDSIPRQQMPQYFRLNGAIYIRKLAYTEKEIYLMDKTEVAYIMPKYFSVDIDDIVDFKYAEALMTYQRELVE